MLKTSSIIFNCLVLGLILTNAVLVFTESSVEGSSDIEPGMLDPVESGNSTLPNNSTDSPKVYCTWVTVEGIAKNKMLLCAASMAQLPSPDLIHITINKPEKPTDPLIPTSPKLTFKQRKTAFACGLINDVAGDTGGKFWKKMLKCEELMKNQVPTTNQRSFF